MDFPEHQYKRSTVALVSYTREEVTLPLLELSEHSIFGSERKVLILQCPGEVLVFLEEKSKKKKKGAIPPDHLLMEGGEGTSG